MTYFPPVQFIAGLPDLAIKDQRGQKPTFCYHLIVGIFGSRF